MAATLQTWYHKIFEQTPPKGLLRHLAYQAAGVAGFTVYISSEVWLFDKARPAGGRGLIFLLITDGQRSYGPAGVVLALISFLVGFGVCLHAGAVFGRMWNDWQDERATLRTQSGRD